jgi:hypothetical protein
MKSMGALALSAFMALGLMAFAAAPAEAAGGPLCKWHAKRGHVPWVQNHHCTARQVTRARANAGMARRH